MHHSASRLSFSSISFVVVALCGILGLVFTGRAQSNSPFQLPADITKADYVPGVIVVKVQAVKQNNAGALSSPSNSSQARTSGTIDPPSSLNAIQRISQATDISPVIAPTGPLSPQARTAVTKHPLASIYKVETNQEDIIPLIHQLEKLEEVVYAEPYYLLKPLDVYGPNDPSAQAEGGEQDYLATVHAYEAWAIEKGSADVIIGILDTGVEFGHQDLTDNLYVNSADPINGIDDDGDGYTDNYVGWDMADHDNDPTADTNGHGTLVAGVAAATSDNNVGIAGMGFHSSYMPIKIFRSGNGAFAFGYEAIAYAADRGCQVINLSWGGANAYSRFGEDIINYAVLEKDAVIVAAAGNSGKEEKYYPASYENVLSVGVTDAQDNKVAQTAHNYWIDMVAPGNRNYSTRNEDGYTYSSGSSVSAPLVAGTAALIRAHYPQLSAMQVMQQLRMSTDDIYSVGSNDVFREKLGRGRLNAARALQPLNSPAIRAGSATYANHVGQYAYFGDTLDVGAVFKNYLSPASKVTITLSCTSEYVTVLDSLVQLASLDSLEEATHTNDPFRLYLHEDLPANEELIFRIGFSAGSYQDYQYISIISSPEYAMLDNGTLALSIGSNGDLGYNPTAIQMTRGLQQQQQTLAPQLGLLVATDADHVSDNVIQSYRTYLRSQDFTTTRPIKYYVPSVGTQVLRSSFSDAEALQPLGVAIEQTWLADTSAQNKAFLIGEYRIVNTGEGSLDNLKTGLFADWNLSENSTDRAAWDASHQLGYVYNELEEQYTGVVNLTGQVPIYHAIDQESLNGNTADTEGEFTDPVKYDFVSQGVSKAQSGSSGSGNNVAHVVGETTTSLATNQAAHVSFALVVGSSLEELQQAAQAAQRFYVRYQNKPLTLLTVPACVGQPVTVQVPGESQLRFYRDPRGTQLLAEGDSYKTGTIAEDTAIYVASVRNGYESSVSRVAIRLTKPAAQFVMDPKSNYGVQNDTLFLDESDNHTVGFWDESMHAVAWQWDFGNGFQSTAQHPITRYTKPGRYTVSLAVTSSPGCSAQTSRTITVVRRAERPVLSDRTLCPGNPVTIQASNTQQIKVYEDEALTHLLFAGAAFTSDPIEASTDFFVVNVAGSIPSVAQPVHIAISAPMATISYALDTMSLSQRYGLRLQARGTLLGVEDLAWYVNEVYVGSTPEFIYDFSALHAQGTAINITLEYTQDNGDQSCLYRLSEKVNLTSTPTPDFSSLRICQGESATLQPTNGTMFYFYLDEQRDSLIHKGSALELGSVQTNQTFYVTNMSGFLESDPVAVRVELNSFADFTMSTDTLYLSETNEAVFEAFAKGQAEDVSWQWDLGEGTISHRSSRVIQRFDSIGTYQIRLLAKTEEGCVNTVTRTLVVENVTGLQKDQEEESFRVYPNPTSGNILLENRYWFQKDISIRLLTIQGQEVARHDMFYGAFPLPINLHELASVRLISGLYLLHIQRGNRVFVRKVCIQY